MCFHRNSCMAILKKTFKSFFSWNRRKSNLLFLLILSTFFFILCLKSISFLYSQSTKSDSLSSSINSSIFQNKASLLLPFDYTKSNRIQPDQIDLNQNSSNNRPCPSYFSKIFEDLTPWKTYGVSKKNLDNAVKYSNFRFQIINGQLYLDLPKRGWQTRVNMTVWGILMMLKKYGNAVADVDVVFCYEDKPRGKIVRKTKFFKILKNETEAEIFFSGEKKNSAEEEPEEKSLRKMKNFFGFGSESGSESGLGSESGFGWSVSGSEKKFLENKKDNLFDMEAKEGNGFFGSEKKNFSEILYMKYLTEHAPLLFMFCNSVGHDNIVFPDWTFWGWPELQIRPWEEQREKNFNGQKNLNWNQKTPKAYWRGNVKVGGGKSSPNRGLRKQLIRCARKYTTEIEAHNIRWNQVFQNRSFTEHLLEKQCNHRYKIYAGGNGWSVSLKYELACNSTLLLIRPHFFDFYNRGLVDKEHAIVIERENFCENLKQGVLWGNENSEAAQKIARTGLEFARTDLAMDRVYDYMFHVLSEYSKLLQFKPTVLPNSTLITPQIWREQMDAAAVKDGYYQEIKVGDSENSPCELSNFNG